MESGVALTLPLASIGSAVVKMLVSLAERSARSVA